MNKTNVKELIKNNAIWLLGCSLYSIGVNSFTIPNSIAQSGMTGLAVVFNYLFEVQ